MRDGSKTLETELQRISGYELVRNSLFFACSSSSKVCGGNFRGFVGLNLQRFNNLWFLEVSEGL